MFPHCLTLGPKQTPSQHYDGSRVQHIVNCGFLRRGEEGCQLLTSVAQVSVLVERDIYKYTTCTQPMSKQTLASITVLFICVWSRRREPPF